jgi:uracil-DNA glycosylase
VIIESNPSAINLSPSWLRYLAPEFEQPYMRELKQFLLEEKSAGKVIYPKGSDMFNAFNSTAFDDVKVVILGQDPYHGTNQAHGLCFSVQKGVRIPPSLLNIFKEIQRDLGFAIPSHGCLQGWAEQGVLLLNATLTVEQARAGSHQGKGWETFTDNVIQHLNDQRKDIVFLLWGSYAHKKGQLIDHTKHLVLKSVHPSPLSAHRGFLGNGHFSAANQHLIRLGLPAINWQIV